MQQHQALLEQLTKFEELESMREELFNESHVYDQDRLFCAGLPGEIDNHLMEKRRYEHLRGAAGRVTGNR